MSVIVSTSRPVIQINSTTSAVSGEANTASNLGSGQGIYYQKVGVDLQFKSLIAGSGISLNSDTNNITITSSASAWGGITGTLSSQTDLQNALNAKQPLDSTLTSLAAFDTNGILVQTAADTFLGRTLVAGTNKLIITNGNGVGGNPQVDIVEANFVGIPQASVTNLVSDLASKISANQTITLVGDVTGIGSTNITTIIANDSVSFAKTQNIGTNKLLGRATAGTGDIEEISLGAGLTLTSGTLELAAAPAPVWGAITGTLSTQTDLQNALDLKLDKSLVSTHIFVGNGSNIATDVALSGDLTITNTGVSSVVGIQTKTLPTLATGFLKYNGSAFIYDNSTYLTSNQSITISGDVSGSGTTSIPLALATVNSNIGSFNTVVVNAKGLVTSASNTAYLTNNQTITLSGDITGSGTTAISGTIPNDTVTYAKIQNVPSSILLGRYSAGNGDIQEITLGSGLSLSGGGVLSSSGGGGGSNPFADNIALVKNNSDNTKLAILSAASITTATTRTYTLPNFDGTLALLGSTNGATLSKTDDTNVTLTLGGTPNTALLAATSLTLGWTGTLAYSRFVNGTGLSVVGRSANSSGVQADITGTTDQILRISSAGTTLGFGSINLAASAAVGSSILPIVNGGTGSSSFPGYLLASGGTLTEANTITGTTTNTVKYVFNNLGTTVTNGAGLWLANTQAALSGAQQVSPSLVLEGQGFNSTGSTTQSGKWAISNLPVQASGNIGQSLRFQYSINGGAYANWLTLTHESGGGSAYLDFAPSANTFIRSGSAQIRLSNSTGSILFNAGAGSYTSGDFVTVGGYSLDITASSPTARSLVINPTYNITGGTPLLIGVDIVPTITAIGSATELAIRAQRGNVLIGATTITASTRVDIRGTGTTTNGVLRLADSGNTEYWKWQDNGVLLLSTSAGTSGQVLTSQGSGTAPIWTTVSGTGDMILASAQTSTAKKTFSVTGAISGINVGANASDPTTTLVAGDLYYQTGVGVRVYSGSAWSTIGAGGGSGITRSIINQSTNVTAGATASTDYVYNCTSTFTLTLPTAVGNTNKYTIKNSGTGTITINTTSSQTIDGGLTATISVQYNSFDVVSDGSNWIII